MPNYLDREGIDRIQSSLFVLKRPKLREYIVLAPCEWPIDSSEGLEEVGPRRGWLWEDDRGREHEEDTA